MSIRRPRLHGDRGLDWPAVRAGERDGLRRLAQRAVGDHAGRVEAHYYPGQQRVPFAVLGCALYAVVAKDKTGWGRGGVAVVTVLTPEQVRAREGAVRLG